MMDNFDYRKLNPGIRNVVKLLRQNGFLTIESGDGATHEFECDRPNPYVVVRVDPHILTLRASVLMDLLKQHGVDVVPINDDALPAIQASYDPANDMAFIEILDVTDDMLRDRQPA